MSKKLKELKEWAIENVSMINLLPPNEDLEVTTRLIDVLEDEVDEKYYLSEEKTKKLTLDHDLGGKLNMYNYNERDKVHSVNKVSPTLNTMQGGDRQPKIVVVGNTSSTGHRSLDIHDVNGISPTIAARDYKGAKQIAIPVLTPERLNKIQNRRRFKEDVEPMFTLTSQDRHGVITNNIRIRKLTEKECWRLQGFADEQFYKAKDSGVSNSQLYKQSGNSVTVNVVDAIVKQLKE
ncbi:DNA cytosine methyltransferase [Mammaliicoccus vitulinus]|uniref:DNA cytosine methyltransferase n=1 Tax=Mammaliicoccus vitulinus TaxID=71237 RepID=UPI002B25732F|nr:DNA cytosine methyltransferase [Mammaliicoccus vitulinus]WQK87053.1 DNA cytosine methyltransferase [Mammaliicoccus vitulinus]